MTEKLWPKFALWLRLFVIVTQGIPGLREIYHFIYILTLKIFLRRLSQDFQIISVYLKGSMARGNPCYGLSDIDLFLLVKGDLCSGHGAVRFAEVVEKSRKGFFFKIIGEIEVLGQKEWDLLNQKTTVVYVELFPWKHLAGEKLELLETKTKCLTHLHRLQFACFQYLLYVNSVTFQDNFLGTLKKKRLFNKLSRFVWGNDDSHEYDFLQRFESELGQMSIKELKDEVLILRGLYPFLLCSSQTMACVGSYKVRQIREDDRLVFARAVVSKTIKDFVFTFFQERSEDKIQRSIYFETLIFQKFGGIINLYDKGLKEKSAMQMIKGMQEAMSEISVLSDESDHLLNQELGLMAQEFCQNVLMDLRKLT